MQRCAEPGRLGTTCPQTVFEPGDRFCYFHHKLRAGLFALEWPVRPLRGTSESQVAGVSDETREVAESLAALGFDAAQIRMVLGFAQTRSRR